MSHKMSRREERELALRGIFQLDFHDTAADRDVSIDKFLELAGQGDPEDEVTGESTGYARQIIDAVITHQEDIDGLIKKYLKQDWEFSRVPKSEKAILRLGAAELVYLNIPKEIAINEAVELAKTYAELESKGYINGILNQIAQNHVHGSED
ncbi:MAG: transcription antitermination factor NusB [Eubacterium sp.]|nr:transcription antitermination factor NusB [Eubacterium sp.]